MTRLLSLLLICAALSAADPLVNTNAVDAAHAQVLSESEPFQLRVVVQNPYDVAIKVEKLDATCTCANLKLASTFLLPYATTEMTADAIDNHNRSAAQRFGVSVYLTDPELEAIEVVVLWTVRAHVQVDSLATTTGVNTLERPAHAFQDVYKYPGKVRPDELHKLRKRIRLSCPEGEVPDGGLKITDIQYTGPLWTFTPTVQSDGSVLIEARGKEGDAAVEERVYDEEAIVLTNHPKKPRIPLVFITYVGKDAGKVSFDPNTKQGPQFKPQGQGASPEP